MEEGLKRLRRGSARTRIREIAEGLGLRVSELRGSRGGGRLVERREDTAAGWRIGQCRQRLERRLGRVNRQGAGCLF
jgi:hypothetical protein